MIVCFAFKNSYKLVNKMNTAYKAEVTGLRAVAIGALILYNAQISFFGFNLFPGGFIGIDLFFYFRLFSY